MDLLIKSEIEKRLKKKRGEVASLKEEVEGFEDSIEDRKARIEVLEDTIQELQSLHNLLPSAADADSSQPVFRQNSEGWLVHDLLRKGGKPLYIDEILEQLEREVTVEARSSLGGQLGGYVRKGQVFTRPAPNTFGLREWEVNGHRQEPAALSLDEVTEIEVDDLDAAQPAGAD
jgi:hypothetical protein